jgi:hypothetical protein
MLKSEGTEMYSKELELKHKYDLYLLRHRRKDRTHNEGSYLYRDSDKNKTYRCEWKTERKFPEISNVLSENDCQKFLHRVLKSKFWREYGKGSVRLEFMKNMGHRSAIAGRGSNGLIRLSPRHSSKYVILHELVHAAGYYNHGRGFRILLLKIVSRFLGREVANDLKENFKNAGLKISKIREPLSYDKWKEKYLRLEGRFNNDIPN